MGMKSTLVASSQVIEVSTTVVFVKLKVGDWNEIGLFPEEARLLADMLRRTADQLDTMRAGR